MRSKYLIILFFLVAGCSKNDRGSDDKVAPVVTILTPTENQSFAAGATIQITGTLTDNSKIVEVHVHIWNETTGTLLVDIHRNPGAGTYALNESFQIPAAGQYRILVVAKDNAANEGHSAVYISAN